MSAWLYGLPGQLKILVDRLTLARAENLDDLDTTVSSRAVASTAVSNITLTDARIAKLDNLDTLVSSMVYPGGITNTPEFMPLLVSLTSADLTIKTAAGTIVNDSSITFFNTIANQGARISTVILDDTWYTVVDISGRGVLTGVVLPGAETGGNYPRQVRITIDGTVYTMTTGTSDIAIHVHPYLGVCFPGGSETTAGYPAPLAGSAADVGFEVEKGGEGNSYYEHGDIFIPSPLAALVQGLDCVLYETSLKVEVKTADAGSSITNNYAAVLGLQLPEWT